MFVIWEPVLPTDLSAPSSASLHRLSDVRVRQYWDPERLLFHTMGERDMSSVVWDYVAIYKPGDTWAEAPPKPVFEARPVVRAMDGANRALQGLTKH